MVGAVVGRDDAAIRAGMHSVLSTVGSHDAFLRRLQLVDMPLQSAMLLLRQSMVPAMNYCLRCITPSCIEDEAQHFDQRVMEATMNKLGLDEGEWSEQTLTLMKRKLSDGGWGLTPAARTSPAAFLGSMVICHAEPVFSPYCDATPIPCSSLLRGWIGDSIARAKGSAR